ncbi:MAG: hypothetical protein ABSH38_21895 [Verrucomicrobiota bacterium]|jgi:hypothetical protein
MNSAADGSAPPAPAWQPLTFGGVAAFAGARLGRLLVVELLAAVVFSAAVVWFLQRSYSPIILQAIQKMPETARLAGGQLQGVPGALISESKFLAIAVTPEPGREIGQGADLQIQLRPADLCVGSVFQPDWGWQFDYGTGTTLDLSRTHLEPWWGAWQPVLWTGLGVALVLLLFAAWWAMATVYVAPAMFLGWFADRNLSWVGAWRLASAALMPGALLMAAAVFSYAWHTIDLLGLSFFFTAHLIIGWVYLVGGVCAAPRLFPRNTKQNPFAS